jgi:hypothetical protein
MKIMIRQVEDGTTAIIMEPETPEEVSQLFNLREVAVINREIREGPYLGKHLWTYRKEVE